MATLECEVQFCPFKSSGEEAQRRQAPPEEKPAAGRKLIRRATKSFITPQHKGVLTVAIISASNLSVRPCRPKFSLLPWLLPCHATLPLATVKLHN